MCTHDLWTRQMNFVKLHSKIHSPFLFLVLSSFSSTSSLPSFSSSGVLDANQVPKPSQNQAMNSKAKTMSDGLSIKWKGWCCSFLMGCNCSLMLRAKLWRGGGRENSKDCSIDCAAIWRRGKHKAKKGGFERIGDGRQTRQRTKMGNPLKVWGKYVVCLLMA